MSHIRTIQPGGRRSMGQPAIMMILIWLLLLAGLGAASAYQPVIVLALMAGLPAGLGLMAWPALTLGLYVNAGLFKADPRLSSLTGAVDLTLGLAAALIGTIVYYLLLRRERFGWSREMSVALTFAGLILLGLLFTPASSYGMDKAFRFIVLTLLAFFAPIILIKSYRSVQLFFWGWLALAAVLTLDSLGRLGSGETLSAFNATTISTSRTLGIAIIILLFMGLLGKTGYLGQLGATVALGLMMLVMVGTGSRGPLLMLGGTVAVTMGIMLVKPGRRTRALVIVAILGVTVLAVFLSGLIPAASLDRFNSLFSQQNGVDTSAQARLQVMAVAWQLFMTNPLTGRGVGSVSAFGVGRELIYPHNILLELAAETGLVGVGIFLSLFGMVVWRLLKKLQSGSGQEPLWLTLLAMLLFNLLNAMVSGDLNDGRDMWLLAGMTIAATEIGEEAAWPKPVMEPEK